MQTDLLTDIPRIETRSHTPPGRKAPRGAGSSDRTLQCTCHDPTADQHTRLKQQLNSLHDTACYRVKHTGCSQQSYLKWLNTERHEGEKQKDHLQVLGVDGTTLKWIFREII